MPTISETLRADGIERSRGMTPGERVAEALALGSRAVDVYCAAHRLDRDEASRNLSRAAQAERRPSRVMRDIIE